ncbi:MAG TPA: DUF6585 family protein [Gemmataceae bacterium]|nr:DUF6585 family protein [Gemmataceae bacterium]
MGSARRTSSDNDRPISRHASKGRGWGWGEFLFTILESVVGLMIILSIPVWIPWLISPTQLRGPVITPVLIGISLLLAVLFAPRLLRNIAKIREKWNTSVDLYADRLVVRRGQQKKVIPWEDVGRIYRRITDWTINLMRTVRVYEIIIALEDGDRIELGNHLKETEVLAENILELSGPILLDKARQRLQAGETVDFGDRIQANRSGLIVDGKPVSWKTLGKARIQTGNLLLDVGQHLPFEIEIGKVANYHVLLALLQKQAGIARKQVSVDES